MAFFELVAILFLLLVYPECHAPAAFGESQKWLNRKDTSKGNSLSQN